MHQTLKCALQLCLQNMLHVFKINIMLLWTPIVIITDIVIVSVLGVNEPLILIKQNINQQPYCMSRSEHFHFSFTVLMTLSVINFCLNLCTSAFIKKIYQLCLITQQHVRPYKHFKWCSSRLFNVWMILTSKPKLNDFKISRYRVIRFSNGLFNHRFV